MTDTRNPKEAFGNAKVPLHLWPISATIQGAMALFLGKTKYGRCNWRATPVYASTYYRALMSHASRWWEGEENDPDDKTPHLGNALACLAIIIDAKVCGTLIDDRQFNGDNVVKTFEDLASLMPALEDKYLSRNPHHYSRMDTIVAKPVEETKATAPDSKPHEFLIEGHLKDTPFMRGTLVEGVDYVSVPFSGGKGPLK